MDYGEGQGKGAGLDTVRALHQTVIALRAALEESKHEILELKSKALPIDSVQETLRSLSVENHILRRKLINANSGNFEERSEVEEVPGVAEKRPEASEIVEDTKSRNDVQSNGNNELITPKTPEQEKCPTARTDLDHNVKPKKVTLVSPKLSPKNAKRNIEARILIKSETVSSKNISRSLESLTVIKSPLDKSRSISFSKTFSFSNLSNHISREFNFGIDEEIKMSDADNMNRSAENDVADDAQNDLDQADEVDDIELIFTTDDTKDSDFKEQLVSIESREASRLPPLPLGDMDQNLDVSDREMDDDVFNDNFENENQENSNFQSTEWKRDNSQLYDSKSDTSINQEKSLKSYYSLQDSSFDNKSLEKDESFDRFEERIQIVETDISKCGIHDVEFTMGRRNTCPNPIQYRPLLHREAMSKGYALSRKSRPILTQSNAIRKESGAQTDISALPGSSWRSESSLANKAQLGDNFTTLPSKCPLPGSRLRLSEKTVEARRVLLSDIGFTSMVPELSRSADHLFPTHLKPSPAPAYGQFLRATDLYSPGCTASFQSQKFSWAATTASPSNDSQSQSHYSSLYPLSSPPPPSRRCSAPVSPSRKGLMKQTPSKVRFANGSLPELRGDWSTVDSGDSTDSLVEEAENYLRRSIDCIMTGRDMIAATDSMSKKSVPRRASAPEAARDNVPPSGWQPFLPRVSRDLKLDHWVKVITPEGRVRGGRVRYVGLVVSQIEQFVGVQLSNPDGYCDGTFNSRKYFQCEPYHGIFVPFKKVIMGWRP